MFLQSFVFGSKLAAHESALRRQNITGTEVFSLAQCAVLCVFARLAIFEVIQLQFSTEHRACVICENRSARPVRSVPVDYKLARRASLEFFIRRWRIFDPGPTRDQRSQRHIAARRKSGRFFETMRAERP